MPVSQSHFHLSVSPLQMSQKQIMPVEVKINVIGVSLRHIVMLENFELFLLCNMFNNQNKCCWSVWERMSLEVTSENTVSWAQTPQRCQIVFPRFLIKTKNLWKCTTKMSRRIKDWIWHLIQMSVILSVKQKLTFLRNECTLLVKDFYYCTRSYIWLLATHFATRTYLIKPWYVVTTIWYDVYYAQLKVNKWDGS